MSARKKWIAGAILGGVLVFGIAVGSVTTWALMKRSATDRYRVSPALKLRKEPYVDVVLGRMERELNLDPEQREAIYKEMQQMAGEFRSLHDHTGGEMRKIIEKGQEQIESHLKPEQIRKFKEHVENRHFRMKKYHSREDHAPADGRHGGFGPGRNDDDDFPMMPPPPPPPPPDGE